MTSFSSATIDELIQDFDDLEDERSRHRYLLELGRGLPKLSAAERVDENLVRGCLSRVWLIANVQRDAKNRATVEFVANSDGDIVNGLIYVLMALYNGRPADDILSTDIVAVFDQLKLGAEISPRRRDGFFAMVNRIRRIAAAATDRAHVGPLVGKAAANANKSLSTDRPSAIYDVERIRADFPILGQTLPNQSQVTYLDTAASAQKPQCVIDREREVYEQFYANAYRGAYRFGAMVNEALEETRAVLARFVGAKTPDEIVFTSGTTMSLNLVAHGWGRKFVRAGDEILLNQMEHHANLVPWQMLAHAVGATLRYLPLTPEGELDLSQLDQFLTRKTKVVAVTGMSNVLGTINPVRELAARAHAVGAKIVVDGAQSVPHVVTRVTDDDIDFLAFSGHKLYGPSGVGVLYGKWELLEAMDPFLGGGNMIETVELDHSTWNTPPAKFEAGTLPIAQAIALRTAADYVEGIGLEAAHSHEQGLLREAITMLSKIDGWRTLGPGPDKKGAILSFVVDGVHADDLARFLNVDGVYVRHGHHCTMPLHKWLGISASIRASFGVYSTTEDVIRLAEAVDTACRKLRS